LTNKKERKKERQGGGGVSHTLCGLANFTLKEVSYIKAKEES
jgi:hypothetical protein